MKRLLDRFVSSPAAARDSEPVQADDEGFFSTQFMERPEQARANSAWQARALAVGAHALDADVGLALLLKAWGQDAFMASLDEATQRKLLGHLQFVTVPAGRELIVQDEKGDYALIVLEGLVAVDRVQPTGARARLAEAREGDVLGEMSLLDAGARFASCLTLSRCALAVLTTEALDEFAIEEPRLGMALMTSIARRLSLRMRQLSARLGALLTAG
ncbi:Crp/Fnr family transcriptional regulator [Aquabacterium sp.]|jgi:CRP/FNR family cyclic AMP-dependent transcriptional regulator|uniref:Crp/Fnr family transcriptional regulator n=1 Tax=Aquabacterium sp. TaxID=1872578 RepID=UPI0025BBD1E2|nr:Crp/Fnr family transcriptional regulator [Aquabacterium sp.]